MFIFTAQTTDNCEALSKNSEDLQEPDESQVEEWADELVKRGILVIDRDESHDVDKNNSSVELSSHIYDDSSISLIEENSYSNSNEDVSCEANQSNVSLNNSSSIEGGINECSTPAYVDPKPIAPTVIRNDRCLSTVYEESEENLTDSEEKKQATENSDDDDEDLLFCPSDHSINRLLQQIAEETGQAIENNVPTLHQELMQFLSGESDAGTLPEPVAEKFERQKSSKYISRFDTHVNMNSSNSNGIKVGIMKTKVVDLGCDTCDNSSQEHDSSVSSQTIVRESSIGSTPFCSSRCQSSLNQRYQEPSPVNIDRTYSQDLNVCPSEHSYPKTSTPKELKRRNKRRH